MATRKFTLTDAQTAELRQAHDRTKDGPTLTRFEAVLAANPRLEIVQFPVAAPELNPQEHVWKATRGGEP